MPDEKKLSEAEKKRTTLTVKGHVQRLVAKIASHRSISIEALFEEKDVQTFFQHLLVEEMRKENERIQAGLKDTPPQPAKPGKK